tara:strand:- start:467 stop:1291 length:825 start_codon:yes stop_codon:yes gene_type:complete
MNKKMSFLNIILIILLLYLVVTLAVYLFQRKLLYHPYASSDFSQEASGLGLNHKFEKIKIQVDEDINLNGWFHFKSKEKKTILFLHGNAGNLDNRIYKLNYLGNLDINFLIISWRGYSLSNGKPTEDGLYEDAKTAVNFLLNKGVLEKNIILYGESLGTAVAIEVGQNKNFAGIILEAPFTSMVELGQKYYPFFPVRLLLKDKYESKKKITNLKSPLLIIHGKKDKIVPFYMGEKIFEMANNPKFKYFTDHDDHMVNFDEKLINQIDLFIGNLN